MRIFLAMLFFTLLGSSCRNSNPNQKMDSYFEKEISNRRQILDTRHLTVDSLKVNTAEIDLEINRIILLSKDLENLTASVNRGNSYFKKLNDAFHLDLSEFTILTAAMYGNDIATVLKQNELTLFNRLIFKGQAIQINPATAQ